MRKYKKFFRFLKELGVYSQFIGYTNFESCFHGKKNLNDYLLNTEKRDFIRCSFSWAGTPQGYNFWEKINEWWVTLNGELPTDFKKKLKKLNNSKNL